MGASSRRLSRSEARHPRWKRLMRAGLLLLLLVGGCFRSEPLRCRVDQDCAPFGVCDPLTRTCALPGPDASVGDLAEPAVADGAVPDGALDLAVAVDAAMA